jgi:GTP-binding protein
MKILKGEFIKSTPHIDLCPEPTHPEFAFIGRSNVGKSSLLNMLVGNKKLAKTSGSPGKTQLINHFFINEEWFLVDLPGYGFAKVSKSQRGKWDQMVSLYLQERPNLMCVFALIDIRLEPQKIDLEFLEFLGERGIPFVMVFTKSDKLTRNHVEGSIAAYKRELQKQWEEMPRMFVTSAEDMNGREELIQFIEDVSKEFSPEK